MKYIRHFKYYVCRLMDKAGLLKYFSFSLAANINTKNFRIPVINGIGYYNLVSRHEGWMDVIVQRLYKERQGCILDVGVNLGQTLLKIASMGNGINYYGFEPNPVCCNYCNQLIKTNKLNSFVVFPVGLSDKASVVKLFGDNDHASGASIIENFRENKEKYPLINLVPVFTGDEILAGEKITAINFIKIDVEGAELEVLKGLQSVILQFRPVIIVEILPVYNVDRPNGLMRKQRQDELIQYMHKMNFILFLIHEKEIKLERVEIIPVHSDMNRTNYLLIPAEEISAFSSLVKSAEVI